MGILVTLSTHGGTSMAPSRWPRRSGCFLDSKRAYLEVSPAGSSTALALRAGAFATRWMAGAPYSLSRRRAGTLSSPVVSRARAKDQLLVASNQRPQPVWNVSREVHNPFHASRSARQ
jgi:hypothetical protein